MTFCELTEANIRHFESPIRPTGKEPLSLLLYFHDKIPLVDDILHENKSSKKL